MTDYYLGKREQVAIVDEDGGYGVLTSNTMAANGYVPGKNIVITPDFQQDWQEVLTTGADSREVGDYVKSVHMYPFTMEFVPTDWRFLKYCNFGSVTNTGASSPYTHTFTLTNAVSSFTMEWAKRSSSGGNEVITLTGCVIKKLTVKFQSGTGATEGFITATAECVAQSISIGTTVTTVSANSRDPFQFRMVKYTYNTTEIKEVNNGELMIDSGIDENLSRYCNSTLNQNIGEPIPRVARYTARINLNYNADTYSVDFNSDAAISGTNKLEIIDNASTNNMVFTWTNLVLKQVKAPTNIESVDSMDLICNIKTLSPVATDSLNTY